MCEEKRTFVAINKYKNEKNMYYMINCINFCANLYI